MCDLQESIHYDTVLEAYQLMHCYVIADRICDTIYHFDTTTKDDFQCISVESPNCYQMEETLYDVSCTDTLEFKCQPLPIEGKKEKEVVCQRIPKKDCYDVPRKVWRLLILILKVSFIVKLLFSIEHNKINVLA